MIDINKKTEEINNQSDVIKDWFKKNGIDPMSNILSINKEIEEHRNELVIDGYNVVRLVDCVDDVDDYYWVYDSPEHPRDKKTNTLYLSSCVCKHTLLKGRLPDKEYNELVRIWNLNNVNKVI